MAFLPYRCIGRSFPGVPNAYGTVGAHERPAPQAFRLVFDEGEGAAAIYNGVYNWAVFSTDLTPGVQPTINWNSPANFGAFHWNVSIRWDPVALLFDFTADLQRDLSGGDVGHTLWRLSVIQNTWNPGGVYTLNFLGHVGGPQLVFDPTMAPEIGTYQTLPAHSCPGA